MLLSRRHLANKIKQIMAASFVLSQPAMEDYVISRLAVAIRSNIAPLENIIQMFFFVA